MTEGVLASFEPIYSRLGEHGWGCDEVDRWELWQVARFMGDEEFQPVIRGNRGLRQASDPNLSPTTPRSANRHGRMDPNNVTPRTSDPGIILTGEAAR